jgi:hypothetical protein
VVEQRQSARRADQPQRGPERLPLPGVRDEPAVNVHHERGRAPAAEFAPLPVLVAAGDELEDGPEVAAADRQASEFYAGGQPVIAAEQHLARGAEVDDGAQPEPVEPLHVGSGQLAERVAAEQSAAYDLQPVRAAVTADIPHVHRAVEGDLTRRGPLTGHRARPIAHTALRPARPA